jgi:hypothetical protein
MDVEGGLWSRVGECVSYVCCEYFTVHIMGIHSAYSILPWPKGGVCSVNCVGGILWGFVYSQAW